MDDPAGEPSAATAKRLGFIRVVISSHVNHQGSPLDFIQRPEPRGRHALSHVTLCVGFEQRQVTKMPLTFRSHVVLGMRRIVMPAGRLRRDSFSILFSRCAAAFLMHMKAVLTSRKASQIGLE